MNKVVVPQLSRAVTLPVLPRTHSSANTSSHAVELCYGLRTRPLTSSDLMRRVAPKLASKWEIVGLLLGMEYNDLKRISRDEGNSVVRFMAVFDIWRRRQSHPYTHGIQ